MVFCEEFHCPVPNIREKMNKKLQALNIYAETMNDPNATLASHEKMTKFIGAFNELVYGVNPFEKKVDEIKIKDEAELEIDEDENEAIAEARPNN